jgi:hypothetical protein
VLAVDEGREQTRAIHVRQRTKRTLEGLRVKQEKRDVLALHRNAQRLLQPLAVVNPYADKLTFLDDKTRTRRDHEKYLTLIDTIALLHQHQRPIKTLTEGERIVSYIEVTPDDIVKATTLAHEVLGRSLDELPPQTRRLLHLLQKMVKGQCAEKQCQQKDYRFSRKEARDYIGFGDTQMKVHLARLVDLELVLAHRGHAGSMGYELLYDGDGSAIPHLCGLIDPQIFAYDDTRSGVNETRSGVGRGAVGGVSPLGRGSDLSGNTIVTRVPDETTSFKPEPRAMNGHGKIVSYTHSVLPLAASGNAA